MAHLECFDNNSYQRIFIYRGSVVQLITITYATTLVAQLIEAYGYRQQIR